jgi:hypothetical protein
MRVRGPLADSYPGAVALVLLALTPYLVLTTALTPLQRLIGPDLGLSPRALQVTAGMANAAYAFGAVLGVQLTVRLPVRRVLVLAAWAPGAGAVRRGAGAPGPDHRDDAHRRRAAPGHRLAGVEDAGDRDRDEPRHLRRGGARPGRGRRERRHGDLATAVLDHRGRRDLRAAVRAADL